MQRTCVLGNSAEERPQNKLLTVNDTGVAIQVATAALDQRTGASRELETKRRENRSRLPPRELQPPGLRNVFGVGTENREPSVDSLDTHEQAFCTLSP
jgi:hypothetical protein